MSFSFNNFYSPRISLQGKIYIHIIFLLLLFSILLQFSCFYYQFSFFFKTMTLFFLKLNLASHDYCCCCCVCGRGGGERGELSTTLLPPSTSPYFLFFFSEINILENECDAMFKEKIFCVKTNF